MNSSLPSPHPSAVPTPSVPASRRARSGRLRVVVGVWWRSLVVAIGGGAVIGILIGLPFLLFADDVGLDDVGVAAYVGGLLGVVLGLIAGAILGGVSAAVLMPFRSAQHCRKVVRLTACLLVGLGLGLFLFPAPLLALPIMALGVGGAFLAAPWVIGWYVESHEVSERP